MKIKILLFALLFIIAQNFKAAGDLKQQPKTITQDAAAQMLEKFYRAYIAYILEFPPTWSEEEWKKMNKLQETYLTKKLLNRLLEANLDYNFVVWWDKDANWPESLKIIKNESKKGAYDICHFNNYYKKETCTTVIVIKENGKYMMDDILDPHIDDMIRYQKGQ